MPQMLLSNFLICLVLSSAIAWDTSQDVLSNHTIISRDTSDNYKQILNFWKENASKLSSQANHKEAVLILGNTGAGKSTLASALVENKMMATRLGSHIQPVFVDEAGRIGTSLLSQTAIPEALTDTQRNVTYIDCPGFRDNRNTEHELSSTYYQNVFMNRIEKMKIVLVINYDSVTPSGNKNDFDDLFDHIGEIFRNISKFNDGIALVATKVPNNWKWSEDGEQIGLVDDDQSILNGIATYLDEKQKIYREKKENIQKYKAFADLIDTLRQQENGSYPRIAIFKQPIREGDVQKLPKTKQQIDTIRNMITENLHFVENGKDDFGLALSQSAKTVVNQIVDDIFRNTLMKHLQQMIDESLTYFSQLEEQHSELKVLRNHFLQAYETFGGVSNVAEPLQLFEKFLDAANTLNIPVSLAHGDGILEDIKALQFFMNVSNSDALMHKMLLKNRAQNFTELIGNTKKIYNFLTLLQNRLAIYNYQKLKNDDRFEQIKLSCMSSVPKTLQNITELENIVKEIDSNEDYQEIKTLELNLLQLERMKAILDDFTRELKFSYIPTNLTVEGYNVRVSDVIKNENWYQAKYIQILALNKIFIDCTVDKTGEEAQIFILAPTWEVIGGPKIILDGKAGEPHPEEHKEIDHWYLRTEDGLAGLPGGSAGHFFGVGKRFINLKNLEISANGGNGGPGQDGLDGKDGSPGEELPRSFFDRPRSPSECREYFSFYGWRGTVWEYENSGWSMNSHWVAVNGKPAVKPTQGGYGGTGGWGGYEGKIMINSLEDLVNVNTFNKDGRSGSKGRGGRGGKGTHNGRTALFDVSRKFPFVDSYKYSNIRYTSESSWIYPFYSIEVPDAEDGMSGMSTREREWPNRVPMRNPYFAINAFKVYARNNLIKNNKESELRSFLYDLGNTEYNQTKYTIPDYLDELEGLEKQYHTLRYQIDFTPFYESLLTRIERFNFTEQPLEIKKALNFIYAAVLTRVFGLKQTRNDRTVVDLHKYLDAIEMNIIEMNETTHLRAVQNHQNKYSSILAEKIQAANDFIQNKINPEISQLINPIQENENSSNLDKDPQEIDGMMQLHSTLRPLKIVSSYMNFVGSFGAVVANMTSIPEKMFIYKNYSRKINETLPVYLNLESPDQVPKVLSVEELNAKLLMENETSTEIHQKIKNLSEELLKMTNPEVPQTIEDVIVSLEDANAVQKTLKELKSFLQQFRYKIPSKFRSNLEHFMDEMDQGLSILIDVYDRIEAYSNSVDQAEYIAYIESEEINNIQVTDTELTKAIVDLKSIINCNIFIEEYKSALHAFKQHYFPFAPQVLKKFELFPDLQLHNSEPLRMAMLAKIRDMKKYIETGEVAVAEYRSIIHESNVSSSDATDSSTFYVWRHEDVKDEIQQLLNGSEILVKADISKGLYQNAVKYNEIGINFKLKNETLQHDFTSALKNFTLTMMMIGNNYYRCGERYYSISFDDNVTISYNFDQDESKNGTKFNEMYSTIHQSHAALSPYGMWSIKLKRVNDSVSWDQLLTFGDQMMDLELIGRGYYIDYDPKFNLKVCDGHLDTYYNVEHFVRKLE